MRGAIHLVACGEAGATFKGRETNVKTLFEEEVLVPEQQRYADWAKLENKNVKT
jgi:hypothetical protein